MLCTRRYSSFYVIKQVEALQCTDGDAKMIRVQLKCRDGNMFNNVIKVVTNCRCKLHPTQPQMRTNAQKMQQNDNMMINPDIMAIAAGQFWYKKQLKYCYNNFVILTAVFTDRCRSLRIYLSLLLLFNCSLSRSMDIHYRLSHHCYCIIYLFIQ